VIIIDQTVKETCATLPGMPIDPEDLLDILRGRLDQVEELIFAIELLRLAEVLSCFDQFRAQSSVSTGFYIIKTSDGYSVWEATPDAVFQLTREDPSLHQRLERAPSATRAEAEKRCDTLAAKEMKRHPI